MQGPHHQSYLCHLLFPISYLLGRSGWYTPVLLCQPWRKRGYIRRRRCCSSSSHSKILPSQIEHPQAERRHCSLLSMRSEIRAQRGGQGRPHRSLHTDKTPPRHSSSL
eukprot:c27679_g1_i1 orf=2-322(-)